VLRAFDKATGKVVAEIILPAIPSGTPMTFMVNGKQLIVFATSDAKLVALGL
jgi:quinoprotein glucose dehydrogenase